MKNNSYMENLDIISGIQGKGLSQEELKLLQDKLNYICENYDPYSSKKDWQIKEHLQELGLQDIEDPFALTNILLRLLDQVSLQINSEDS